LFDIDGVLCSGDILYLDTGAEIKVFDVTDGMGITLAHMAGLKTGIITSRESPVITRRAKELKIEIISQGNLSKGKPYKEIKNNFALSDEEICYVGDDLLDLPILNQVGFSVAVANAREEVKAACDYITVSRGGKGAIREVIDLILKRQGKFDKILNTIMEQAKTAE
jgi:3-deoxy-D-manno-octulosonate 8-phosphate phosphatase (KDO 8-P phosphatase)